MFIQHIRNKGGHFVRVSEKRPSVLEIALVEKCEFCFVYGPFDTKHEFFVTLSFVSRHDRTQCVGILFAGEHVMLDYAPVTFQFCKLKKRVSSVAFT